MALAFVNFYFWTILIVLKHVHFESQRLDMTYLRQCNVCFQYLTLAIDLPAHWIRELCGCASHRSKGAGGSVADGDQGGRGGHPVVHQPPLSSVSLNFLFLLLLHISHCALDKYVNEWSTTAKRRWTHLLWSWLNLVHPFLALAPTCRNCFKVTLFSPFFTFYQDMGCSCCHKAKRWRGLGARGCWRRHEEQFRAEGDIFKVWWNQKLVGGWVVVVVVVVVVVGDCYPFLRCQWYSLAQASLGLDVIFSVDKRDTKEKADGKDASWRCAKHDDSGQMGCFKAPHRPSSSGRVISRHRAGIF